MQTLKQILKQKRIEEIRSFLDQRKYLVIEPEDMRLRQELRSLLNSEAEDERPTSKAETLELALQKIAGMEDILKAMCEDQTVPSQVLMASGFRGAVRIAKQALKEIA